MAFGNYVAKPAFFCEDFGPSILSLSLTLNVEPCRRSRLKRSASGEPVNAYKLYNEVVLLSNGNKISSICH
ncbi:MAG: hypothetical protein B1H12_10960 [Desulfobacteraceae bacterium 4484_190.2]|nr:MAG: hypothetical protein B1H12_10960 [Desulfobacteraceae bacterium 4484_190.2]